MKDFVLMKLLGLAVPLLIGPLAYVAMRYLKRGMTIIDAQSPAVKRILLFAVSFVLVLGTQALGLTLPAECVRGEDGLFGPACFDVLSAPVFMKTVVAALLGHVMHALKKSNPKT